MKILFIGIAIIVGLVAGYVTIILEGLILGEFGIEYSGWSCKILKTEMFSNCESPPSYVTAGLYVIPALVAISSTVILYSKLTQSKE